MRVKLVKSPARNEASSVGSISQSKIWVVTYEGSPVIAVLDETRLPAILSSIASKFSIRREQLIVTATPIIDA